MLIVRAPVRLSFFGGGTDLPSYYTRHGGAVLSVAINRYFYAVVTELPARKVQLISADLRVMQTLDTLQPEAVEGDLQIPLAALKRVGVDRGASIFLASEIPPGTGLGSSGAVSVCMVKALSAFQQRHYDRYALAETAYYINSEMLGHPGGKQDEYGSAFGGLKRIEFLDEGVTVRTIDLDPLIMRELDSNIMLFFTGSSRESSSILSRQKKACSTNSTKTVDALSEIRDMVDKGVDAVESGDLHRFGELLHETWQAKKRVAQGVSNPEIDRLYDLAREHGAAGGKIAGAGGGGFLMLYCEQEARPRVARAMAEAGLSEMFFNFDHEGATVIYDDPFTSGGRQSVPWSLVELQ